MGREENFIQFKRYSDLKKELKKYQSRATEEDKDLLEIRFVDRVNIDLPPFKKGEYLAVVSGERSYQRTAFGIKSFLRIRRVKKIVPMDDVPIDIFQNHFESYSLEEFMNSID
ncbi:hypothetical protein H0266_18365 [Halobacillus locisalis]|uniref:Uncharacterized protein n=1 Tax=Halobacillus locisalis TaxID=220753 RepID=A0A838CXT2_9BACI|nr:hypothetical protein [Halobacillus locisalis]MBA2176847.1 hypothetical protein [Halobacillus locisalis]